MAPSQSSLPICTAGRISWNRASWDSFGWDFLNRMPHLSLKWLHSQKNCQSSGGSVSLSWHWPRVPSCNALSITRIKTRSDCWAWHQSSMVIQVTCMDLSLTASRTHRFLLYALMGLMGPSMSGNLLYGLHCHCSDLEVSAQGIRHAPWPGHPWYRASACWYWSSLPYNTIENCNWLSWPPISDLHSIQLGYCQDIGQGDCYLYRHQRSIHKGIHGLSSPQLISGWETPVCGQDIEIRPSSSSYWCRRWQHPYHPHESGRGQPPSQTHKHWYGVLKAWWNLHGLEYVPCCTGTPGHQRTVDTS